MSEGVLGSEGTLVSEGVLTSEGVLAKDTDKPLQKQIPKKKGNKKKGIKNFIYFMLFLFLSICQLFKFKILILIFSSSAKICESINTLQYNFKVYPLPLNFIGPKSTLPKGGGFQRKLKHPYQGQKGMHKHRLPSTL